MNILLINRQICVIP